MADSVSMGKMFVDLLLNNKQFKKGLTESAEAANTTLPDIQKSFSKLANGITLGMKMAQGAMAGLLTASAVVGSSFEKQMDAVAAVKNITSEASGEFVALEETARRLGATTAYSATEAAQGMEALGRAGLTTNEIISASETALKMAGAGQIELGRSAEILAATMSQFGLEAEESTRISDVFTAATQNTLFGTEDLAQAMKYAGTTGSALGKTIEETTAAVAQFRNLGLEGTLAGNNFKMMMSAAAKPTQEAEIALRKYGLTVEDINPKTNSFAEILQKVGVTGMEVEDVISVFGKKVGLNVAKLSNQFATSTAEYDVLLDTLKDAAAQGTLTSQTYEIMTDNVIGNVNRIKSGVEEVFLILFGTFRDGLTEVLGSIVGLVTAVQEELNGEAALITMNFEDMLGQIASFIRDNTATAARAVADFIITMQNVMQTTASIVMTVGSLVAVLTPLIPLLDEIGILLLVAFSAKKAAAITSMVYGVYALATGVTGATTTITAFGTALTVSTGGLYAAVAAIGVIVVALTALTYKYFSTADATDKLRVAQERLIDLNKKDEEVHANYLQTKLAATHEAAMAEIESGKKISASRRSELEMLAKLDAAQAGRLVRSGELVEIGDRIESASALAAQGASGIAVLTKEITSAKAVITEYNGRLKAGGVEGKRAAAVVREHEARVIAYRLAISNATKAQNANNDSISSGMPDLEAMKATFAERAESFKVEDESNKKRKKSNEEMTDSLVSVASVQSGANAMIEMYGELIEAISEESKTGWDEMKESVDGFGTSIKTAFAAGKEGATEKVAEFVKITRDWLNQSGAMRSMGDLAVDVFKGIGNAAKGTVGAVTSVVKGLGEVGDVVMDVFSKVSGFGGFGASDVTSIATQASDTSYQGDGAGGTSEAGREEQQIDQAKNLVDVMIDEAINQAEALVTMVEPIIDQFIRRVPDLIDAVVKALPKIVMGLVNVVQSVLWLLPDLILTLLTEMLPKLIAKLASQIPVLINAVVTALPLIIRAVVEAIPVVIEAIIGALPEIIFAVVEAIPIIFAEIIAALPQIAIALVEGIITSLLPALPQIVVSFFAALISGMGKALKAVAEGIWNAIKDFFNIFKRKDGKDDKSKGSAFTGVEYVPATMRMTVHKGEAVVPADRNAAMSSASAPAPAGHGQNSGGGGGGGGGSVELAVLVEGRLVDAAQITAARRGHADGIMREIRKASGVTVKGFSPGSFSAFSK